MHFHQLLRWCHKQGVFDLRSTQRKCFRAAAARTTSDVALPVVHCSADFLAPIHGGDALMVMLEPRRLDPGSFEVRSHVLHDGSSVGRGLLRHVAIQASTRRRCNLPEGIDRWLEASGLGRINVL